MDEKTMVNDILAGVKADLTGYQTAISEAENMELGEILLIPYLYIRKVMQLS